MSKNIINEFALYLGRPSGFGNFTEWELLEDNYHNMRLKDWRDELYLTYKAGWDAREKQQVEQDDPLGNVDL